MTLEQMQEYVQFLSELGTVELSDEMTRLYSVQNDAAVRMTLVTTVQSAYKQAEKEEATA